MKTVTLNNGRKMPMIGYGTYKIPASQAKERVLEALEVGYRLIDTAQNYGNEAGVGDALLATDIPREEIFVTTKVQSNRNVAQSIETSLSKLKTDYIDLVLIHWVMGNDLQTYRVLEEYVKKGKIKSLGLSNFYGKDYDNIVQNCEIYPAVVQQETHVFYQNKKLQEIYRETGTYLEAWSPFGDGRANMFTNPTLVNLAEKYNRSVAQIILNFLVNKEIIVIPKSSRKERMIENMNSFDFQLENADIKTIEAMDRNESLFGWF